jgi:hypothetical protein
VFGWQKQSKNAGQSKAFNKNLHGSRLVILNS